MEAVKVNSGVLILIPGQDKRALLSPAQLEARMHNVSVLKVFGKNRANGAALVAVNETLHFKAGEVVGIDLDKARRDKLETVTIGAIAKAAAEVVEEDARDRLAEQRAAEMQAEADRKAAADARAKAEADAKAKAEAAAKAKADAEAKAKLQDEARAAWQASPDLQKQFVTVESYLASQDLA